MPERQPNSIIELTAERLGIPKEEVTFSNVLNADLTMKDLLALPKTDYPDDPLTRDPLDVHLEHLTEQEIHNLAKQGEAFLAETRPISES